MSFPQNPEVRDAGKTLPVEVVWTSPDGEALRVEWESPEPWPEAPTPSMAIPGRYSRIIEKAWIQESIRAPAKAAKKTAPEPPAQKAAPKPAPAAPEPEAAEAASPEPKPKTAPAKRVRKF